MRFSIWHKYASSTVCAVNSYRSPAGNLRQLEDFQFEVFTVQEAVSLSYQPSDLVVESLHLGVADMPEGPVTDDPVQFFCLFDGLCRKLILLSRRKSPAVGRFSI